jgi:hypothetical protein
MFETVHGFAFGSHVASPFDSTRSRFDSTLAFLDSALRAPLLDLRFAHAHFAPLGLLHSVPVYSTVLRTMKFRASPFPISFASLTRSKTGFDAFDNAVASNNDLVPVS